MLPTYVASWFNGCTNLTEVNNIEYLDTRNVTSMQSMFQNCSRLEILDLSGLNMTKLTNIRNIKYGVIYSHKYSKHRRKLSELRKT